MCNAFKAIYFQTKPEINGRQQGHKLSWEAEKAVAKRLGPSSRTLDKESLRPKSAPVGDISIEMGSLKKSPRPKSLAVTDISMEVGSLKKTMKELK